MNKKSELSYVEKMSTPATLAEVPSRLIARYVENFGYLVNTFMKMFEVEDIADVRQSVADMHGFKKLLILLTEPGKIFALQSFDGAVKWTFYIPQEKVIKVFVQH